MTEYIFHTTFNASNLPYKMAQNLLHICIHCSYLCIIKGKLLKVLKCLYLSFCIFLVLIITTSVLVRCDSSISTTDLERGHGAVNKDILTTQLKKVRLPRGFSR